MPSDETVYPDYKEYENYYSFDDLKKSKIVKIELGGKHYIESIGFTF